MSKETSEFHQAVIQVIKNIPKGRVASYGQVACLAGKPGAARQIAWFLHSSSRKYKLPWHRVINSQGKISLPDPHYSKQKRLLKKEGIEFSEAQRVDMREFGWQPDD